MSGSLYGSIKFILEKNSPYPRFFCYLASIIPLSIYSLAKIKTTSLVFEKVWKNRRDEQTRAWPRPGRHRVPKVSIGGGQDSDLQVFFLNSHLKRDQRAVIPMASLDPRRRGVKRSLQDSPSPSGDYQSTTRGELSAVGEDKERGLDLRTPQAPSAKRQKTQENQGMSNLFPLT